MPDWWLDWSGAVACVCASGPSLTQEDVDACRGRKVIVLNETWRLAPWADVLYGCDARWWALRKGVPEFRGLKVSRDPNARKHGAKAVKYQRRDVFLYDRQMIGWGGNGGFQAVNLAIQFGAKRIALLGFDMSLSGGTHWHGEHKELANPTARNIERWRRVLDAQAEPARKRGIEIVNCSRHSALVNYPRMPVGEAFGMWS